MAIPYFYRKAIAALDQNTQRREISPNTACSILSQTRITREDARIMLEEMAKMRAIEQRSQRRISLR